MNNVFNSLPWHDGQLLELSVDRHNPGVVDIVRLSVIWPNGEPAILLFGDCYGLIANMNFGIIAEERILGAKVVEDDPGLLGIRERWKALDVPLDFLSCFRIETSSTASIIQIYANRFEVA